MVLVISKSNMAKLIRLYPFVEVVLKFLTRILYRKQKNEPRRSLLFGKIEAVYVTIKK